MATSMNTDEEKPYNQFTFLPAEFSISRNKTGFRDG